MERNEIPDSFPVIGFVVLIVASLVAAVAALVCYGIGRDRLAAENELAGRRANEHRAVKTVLREVERLTGIPLPSTPFAQDTSVAWSDTGPELLAVSKCLVAGGVIGLLAGVVGLGALFKVDALKEDLATARSAVLRLEADAPTREAGKRALERLPVAEAELTTARDEATRLRTQLAAAESSVGTLQPAASRVPALEAERDAARLQAAELTARTTDPTRKEALIRLLEERAAAREDALLDGVDEAVRAARLAAIDDEFGPKIEAAYAAL